MAHRLRQVLDQDPRYTVQAYEFVRDALSYAHDVMGLGAAANEPPDLDRGSVDADDADDVSELERHLTGQELCEASRRLALELYGLMAQVVLGNWGIRSTSDIGEIVYNMIHVDLMRKSAEDRREDFDDVFDFQKAFRDDFDFATNMGRPRAVDP